MTLRLNGDSSGFTEIKAPNAAGDNSITLPTNNGGANQLLQNGGTAGELQYTSAAGGVVYDSSGRLLVNTASVGTDNFSTSSPLQVQAGTGAYALGIRNRAPENDFSFISFGSADGNEQLANIFCQRVSQNTGSLFFATNGGNATTNTRIAINSDGALRLINTPGIDFSGIQAAADQGTMISETLDSYEQGSFVPKIEGSLAATGQSYTTGTRGNYIKVGKLVHVSFYVELTAMGTLNGNQLMITGLPFTVQNQTGSGAGACGFFNGLAIAVGQVQFNARQATNACFINRSAAGGGGGMVNDQSIISNVSRFDGTFTYITSD